FFFSSRRRHTRWPRDWSSDVCSSDLAAVGSAIALREKGHWVGDGGAGGLKPSATCASVVGPAAFFTRRAPVAPPSAVARRGARRSEERRVGKEGRWRWSRRQYKYSAD